MSGEDDVAMVPNNYKHALRTARSGCVGPAAALEGMLTRARRAMDAGAWQGPMGEDFSGELDRYRRSLNGAGPDVISTLDTAIGAQPETIPSNAWQVRWQQNAPW